MQSFETVLFDLDDTLVEEVASADRAFLAACGIAGERYGADRHRLRDAVLRQAKRLWFAHPMHPFARRIGVASWEALWARFEGTGEEIETFRRWSSRYRRDAWSLALAEQEIEDESLASEMARRFIEARRSIHTLYDDVTGVLDRLRSGGRYRMGIVTNGLSCLQREKIEGAGLGSRFDAVVAGGDVGAGKPDPRIFFHILERLGSVPGEAVMVGNSLEKDVTGARAAGIHAVWLDRTGGGGEPEVVPDARIRTLAELPPLLG